MKKSIFHFFLLCFLFFVNGIYSQDLSGVDTAIQNYPKSFRSTEQLADKINQEFKSEEDKARAIYTWIALNIRYDLVAYKSQRNDSQIAFSYSTEAEKNQKLKQFRLDLADTTLKSKKGVCQGYSALFNVLCELTDLKCIDICGTSKSHPTDIGKLPTISDHAWNAVKIGANWKFIDATWASGAVSNQTGKFVPEFNDAYFFTSPEVFFLNHFPEDTRFLMIDKTAEDFANLPLFYGQYNKAKYKITRPDSGIITLSKSNIIAFEIVDLPKQDRISYVFSSDNKAREVEIKRAGNSSRFLIQSTPRSKGYLTIYVNNKSVASYRIQS